MPNASPHSHSRPDCQCPRTLSPKHGVKRRMKREPAFHPDLHKHPPARLRCARFTTVFHASDSTRPPASRGPGSGRGRGSGQRLPQQGPPFGRRPQPLDEVAGAGAALVQALVALVVVTPHQQALRRHKLRGTASTQPIRRRTPRPGRGDARAVPSSAGAMSSQLCNARRCVPHCAKPVRSPHVWGAQHRGPCSRGSWRGRNQR